MSGQHLSRRMSQSSSKPDSPTSTEPVTSSIETIEKRGPRYRYSIRIVEFQHTHVRFASSQKERGYSRRHEQQTDMCMTTDELIFRERFHKIFDSRNSLSHEILTP